jgi:hypothetical protein
MQSNKIWDKTTISNIAGILAYAITILVLFIPYKEGSAMSNIEWNSPFGIIIIILFIASIVLYGLSILKKEKTLSLRDIYAIVEHRESYLPQLKNTIDAILIRKRELAIEAGKLSLEQYYDKYLKLNKTFKVVYKVLKDNPNDKTARRKVAIITSLQMKNFGMNNVYLLELEDKDNNGIIQLQKDYDNLYSKNTDKLLAKELRLLFKKYAKWAYSGLALVELAKNNGLPYKDPKYIAAFYDKPRILEDMLRKQHQSVNKRFDELLIEGVQDD